MVILAQSVKQQVEPLVLSLGAYYLGFIEGVRSFYHDRREKIQLSAALKLKENKFLVADTG